DRAAILQLYRMILALRNRETALNERTYRPEHSNDQYLVYPRDSPDGESFLVMLNLSSRPCRHRQDPSQLRNGVVELSTSPQLKGMAIGGQIYLSGDEGIVVRLSAARP